MKVQERQNTGKKRAAENKRTGFANQRIYRNYRFSVPSSYHFFTQMCTRVHTTGKTNTTPTTRNNGKDDGRRQREKRRRRRRRRRRDNPDDDREEEPQRKKGGGSEGKN
jgi:hypothetical protein